MAGTTAFLPWARAVSLNQPGCLLHPVILSGPHASVCSPGQGRGRCLPAPPFLISTLGPCRVGSCAWLSPPHLLFLSDLPLFQLSELISAREIFHFCFKPYWDQTGINLRQAVWAARRPGLTHLSVSGGWAEAVTHCPLTPTSDPLPIQRGSLAGPRASKRCTLCVTDQLLELRH